MQGLIGKKIGMTQVYDKDGVHVPVTVIEVGPCVVVQRKIADRDGYEAVQLGFIDQKESRLSKPTLGHFKKSGVSAKKFLREFRVDAGFTAKEGDTLTSELFDGVNFVDITGVCKGRGFQGVVKRHGFGGGPGGHGGNSHRRPGSIGMREKPGRILKNKRMAGHMGNVRVTTQNLKVVQVRKDDHAILVRGAIPGPNGSIVLVSKSIKKD